MSNELKAGHGVVVVAAVVALGSRRPRQQADALVVADGLDADARTSRKGADREGPVAHGTSMGAAPDYRVKPPRPRQRQPSIAKPAAVFLLGLDALVTGLVTVGSKQLESRRKEAPEIELPRSGRRSARPDRGSAAKRVLPDVGRDRGG